MIWLEWLVRWGAQTNGGVKVYYVYRFIDKESNIIYVGKTININNRMKQHFSSSGHLKSECYKKVKHIEYIALPSKIDMNIKELYYINKWKPTYNTKDKQEEEMTVEIDEGSDIWETYETRKEINSFDDSIDRLLNEVKQQIKSLNHDSKSMFESFVELIEQSEKVKRRYEESIELRDGIIDDLMLEIEHLRKVNSHRKDTFLTKLINMIPVFQAKNVNEM